MAIVFEDLQKLLSQSQRENTSKELFLGIREYIKLTHTYCNSERKQIAEHSKRGYATP